MSPRMQEPNILAIVAMAEGRKPEGFPDPLFFRHVLVNVSMEGFGEP